MNKNISKYFLLALSLLLSVVANAQDVKGVVSDASGGLPGVSVLVKGSSKGVETDFDGNYELTGVKTNDVLVFSFLGFKTVELPINGKKTINVQLEEDSNTLDEVVVVGYGTQQRSKVTAAISSVKGKDLAQIPTTDVAQSLQGRASGVNVINSGSPGGRTTINIRGITSLSGGDPLYVVDGVFTSNINAISPSSIEAIDVLKDAASSAIYGSRGANGVIIITTKKGRKGKLDVKFNTSTGIQFNNNRFDVLNTEQYIQYLREESDTFGGIGVVDNDPDFDGNGVDTDWQDEFFKIGFMRNYDFSVAGGGDNSRFAIGASSLDQTGIYQDTEFKRQTFNANSEFNVTNKFKIGETLNLAFFERIDPQLGDGREALRNLLGSAPYIIPQNPDGTFNGPSPDDSNNARNQLRVQDSDDNLTGNTSIIGSIYGEYELLKGLKFKSQFGVDLSYVNIDEYLSAYQEEGGSQFSQTNNTISKSRARNFQKVFTNTLSYQKTFADKHNLDVTLVSERLDARFETVEASEITATNGIQEIAVGTSTSESFKEILISYLGRVNYDYEGKYLASFSIRRDKSSILAPGNQSLTFKAGSLGWVVSKESFLENSDIISNLKVRGSYGESGNNNIEFNGFSTALASNFVYSVGGEALVLGTAPTRADNPDLSWEVNVKQNYGFDLGLYDNKYTFSAEYFNNRTENLLRGVDVVPSAGVDTGSVNTNIGDIRTSGLEFTFGYNDYEGDFTWSAWASVSTYDTETIKLSNIATESFSANFTERDTNVARLAVGESPYHFYGWVFEGVYSDDQEIVNHLGADNLDDTSGASYVVQGGDARYKDVNGDGDINAEDRVIIGDPNPDFTYNVNLKANYKNFDATALITGVQGADIFNTNVYSLTSQSIILNRGTEVLDRWQQPGDITDIPRARFGTNDNDEVSSRYIEDGSYTRLKNLVLGYSINESVLENSFNGVLSKVRLYLQGQNLITVTKYSGLDPEIEPYYGANGLEGYGVDRGRAPQPKTIMMGLQVEF